MRLYQYKNLSTFIDQYTSKKHGNRQAECCGQAFHRESLAQVDSDWESEMGMWEDIDGRGIGRASVYRALGS